MFSNGGWTSPDIWLVLSIFLIAALSVVLNLLVFRHNYYKKRSIARDLFMVLSATDFVSSLVITIAVGSSIAAPIEKQCIVDHNATFCQTSYYKYNRTATITEKAVGGVMWSLGFIPIRGRSHMTSSYFRHFLPPSPPLVIIRHHLKTPPPLNFRGKFP